MINLIGGICGCVFYFAFIELYKFEKRQKIRKEELKYLEAERTALTWKMNDKRNK